MSIECLDVAVERRADLSDGSPVVAYAFGNRCDRPAMVDLAGAHLVGRTADGAVVNLKAIDLLGRIRPLHLDAFATGRESIAYTAVEGVDNLCVDVANIAHVAGQRWLCLSGRAL